MSLASIVSALPSDEIWGPTTTTDALVDGVPYAPYSKGDKLGRMADWTAEGKDREGRGGRQQYNRNYRDQQVYGAGTSSLFAVQVAEDEDSVEEGSHFVAAVGEAEIKEVVEEVHSSV